VWGTTTSGTGVRGSSTSGVGVLGQHLATTGTVPGVSASTNSTAADADALVATVTPTSPGLNSEAVRGVNNGTGSYGIGVFGYQAGSGSGYGVYGYTPSGRGVAGFSGSWQGVYGHSNSQAGVVGESDSFDGVWGQEHSGIHAGVSGHSDAGGYGVWGGTTGSGYAIYGTSPSGHGVHGDSPNGTGVYGTSPSYYGVQGTSTGGVGVRGTSSSCIGVSGASSSGDGVHGFSSSGNGVYGGSQTGHAAYFEGNVTVTGTLTKGGGAFRIDHPLDPAHTYLQHSFVESPDMMDVYNGNVRTDAKGFATVRMPRWFQALNRTFRYQLTSLSGLQEVAIAKEIAHNHFTIQSEKPHSRISWQVTGIRHDRFANANRIKVVVPKPRAEQGKYLHPELYGKPKSEGIGNQKPPNLPSRRSSTR